MKSFEHINAASLEQVQNLLQSHGNFCRVIAGGSDLLGCLKDRIWPEYPTHIINLKSLPAMEGIGMAKLDGVDGVSINALTTLTKVAESELIVKHFPMLVQAILLTASPLLRSTGTIGGNICQENRCWYYRYPHHLGDRILCARKGGKTCFALGGDHRYHSIFGVENKCVAVNPSDTAPALLALDAVICTNKRSIIATEFFTASRGMTSTILEKDEIVCSIFIPLSSANRKSAFKKIAQRKSIDFAIVNGAVSLDFQEGKVQTARICLNAVYTRPLRMLEAEAILEGKALSDESILAACENVASSAKPLRKNGYKVVLVSKMLEDILQEIKEGQ